MAIAIREQGERSKVLAHIQTLVENGADGKPVEDQSQANLIKSAIASEVNALPKEVSGVLVIAEGHVRGNVRQLSVQVIGQEGHY